MMTNFKKIVMMANQMSSGSLSDYIELEWLGSDSSAYIDTAVIPNDNTLLNLDFYVGKYLQYGAFFGNYTIETDNMFRVIFGNNDKNLFFNCNTRGSNAGSANLSNIFVNNRHTLSLSKNIAGLKIDESYYGMINANGNENKTSIALFNRSVTNPFISIRDIGIKVYSCQIYDGDVIIRDLIPALRKSDSKPGMYDLVSGQFFVNQGTGEFSYG